MVSTNDKDRAAPRLPSIRRLLGLANKTATKFSERRLVEHGLTLRQWVLLTALWRRDGLTVGQLAEHYRATEPSTSSLVSRMENKGLLARRHDPDDRRHVRVYLTERGRALDHLASIDEQIDEALLAGFTASEAHQFAAMMERLIANANGDRASG